MSGERLGNIKFLVQRVVIVSLERYTLEQHLALLNTYLCEEEEEELVKWIAGCAEIGYAKSVREIRAVVGAIVSSKLGLDSPIVVSHRWWNCFRLSHPHLVLRTGEGIAFKQLAATNKDTINHYYNLLEETMKDNELLNAPHLIFNCNETGMPLCSRPEK